MLEEKGKILENPRSFYRQLLLIQLIVKCGKDFNYTSKYVLFLVGNIIFIVMISNTSHSFTFQFYVHRHRFC